jgi:hypothetical protein
MRNSTSSSLPTARRAIDRALGILRLGGHGFQPVVSCSAVIVSVDNPSSPECNHTEGFAPEFVAVFNEPENAICQVNPIIPTDPEHCQRLS